MSSSAPEDKQVPEIKLEATHLRGDQWAVRPEGQLGTCGWRPKAWTVQYVKAACAEDAVRKASR